MDVINEAVTLWDRGYRKIDADVFGIVRWHSIVDEHDHPPIMVNSNVWYFIRGCHFGVGDYTNRGKENGV
jgi:hypothetical protein